MNQCVFAFCDYSIYEGAVFFLMPCQGQGNLYGENRIATLIIKKI